MEVKGTIKTIFNYKTISDKFSIQEIVVTTQEQYPQDILVQFSNDGIQKLQGFRVGDEVTVSINLRGRETRMNNGEIRYFNTIQGWSIAR